MDGLDHAVAIHDQTVEFTSVDHPDHPGRLNNLGIVLQRQFESTGSMDDLDRAILVKPSLLTIPIFREASHPPIALIGQGFYT
jgi:hypothetical protein